jgi:hypothetical protein
VGSDKVVTNSIGINGGWGRTGDATHPRRVVALVLPGPVDPAAVADVVSRTLPSAQAGFVVRQVTFDSRDYLIAAWPGIDDPEGLRRLNALAAELGGELIGADIDPGVPSSA